MIAPACNLIAWEIEAGELLLVQGHHGLHSELLANLEIFISEIKVKIKSKVVYAFYAVYLDSELLSCCS